VFAVVATYAKVVAQLKSRLVEELGDGIDSIVLYGSVARKTAGEGSDIDVLVVTRGEDRSVYDRISKLRTRIDLENNTLTAIVQMTRDELEQYVKLGSPFMKSVAEEGVILYDRGIFKKVRGSLLSKG